MPSEKKAETSTAKKVLRIVGNVLIWIFIIFAALVTVLAFAAQSSSDGIPSIAGRAVLTVQTDSMSRSAEEEGKITLQEGWERGFNAGDIIIGKKLTTDEMKSLKVGDVITFKTTLAGTNQEGLNSHRIVEVQGSGDSVVYVTRGDNNLGEDTEPVGWEKVICVYTGTRLPGLGKVLDFLQTSTGFLVVIVIPLVLFFIYELIVFIRKFLKVKNAGKKQITAADEEAIKQKAIEEYLKAQKAEADAAEDVKEKAEEVKAEAEAVEEKAVEVAAEAEVIAEEAEAVVEDAAEEVEKKVEE
ncbi:MAG: signal peptidase I [Clostridia bacterium]|nr:signal peptidase I [Clostridia bacterium]